jgi:hypothetical protein
VFLIVRTSRWAKFSALRHKKSRIFRCGFFVDSLKTNYFAAGAAGAAGAASVAAGFLAAFFFLATFFFAAGFASAAGAAASVAAGAAAGGLAKAIAEKETATRAATSVDRTFFMGTTSKWNVLCFELLQGVCQIKNLT